MASIDQNRYPDRLPDFLNLGVWLRVLLIVTFLSFVAVVLRTDDWRTVVEDFSIASLEVQPTLVFSLLVISVTSPWLRRLDYRLGVIAVFGTVTGVTVLVHHVGADLLDVVAGPVDRPLLIAWIATGLLLFYFFLRSRALSPALTEARLQALQARIRPHFLFNSINAVLSLVRSEPKRAESALEDMADLFRVLMADNRDLVPLADEVQLCRQYLDLEQLRLGDRLRVEWHVDNMPRDAMVPPLVLQPLLENAVYHGIEPSPDPGVVSIDIYQIRGEVHVVLRNPYRKEGRHHAGNKMALGNIRERLALHFDAEGRLESRVEDNGYTVHIRLPYVIERIGERRG